MLLEENSFVTISYCSKTKGVLLQWKCIVSMEAFQSAYNKVLELAVKQYRVKHYCTDLSRVGALTREQETWLTSSYYQRVFEVLKDSIYVAVVFSEGHFKAIVQNYHASFGSKQPDYVNFNYFTDIDEAWDWIGAIQKSQDAALFLSAS
ncbi:hypothetical protein [Pontibacter sp. SGAir0037]|uniref:hypothetical protein n=1 Tax=Pontibacter sp. SGAir0037 TaxID=2571030 RepID=UPI0010CD51B8|nr:hypothetical protein [Pontibacter sp. SGAir0037]QCR21825.1 hypothetical protein C1N53_05395 [Pontibacter sp. SGAir0037]